MFKLLLVCVVVAAAVASPVYDQPIPILRDQRTQNAAGEYSFDFETGDGIIRTETGSQYDGQQSSGGTSYTSPEGQPISITFTSGKEGYVPEGAHLPVAPLPVELPYERSQSFGEPAPAPYYA